MNVRSQVCFLLLSIATIAAQQPVSGNMMNCEGRADPHQPRQAARNRTKKDASGYFPLNGEPITAADWAAAISEVSKRIPRPLPADMDEKPIPGVETPITRLRAFLISARLISGNDLEFELAGNPLGRGLTITALIPSGDAYCPARRTVAGMIQVDAGTANVTNHRMSKPAFVEVTAFAFLDLSQIPASWRTRSRTSQTASEPAQEVPLEAWHLLPVLEVSPVNQESVSSIRASLDQIYKTAETLARNQTPLSQETRDALDYMKKVFVQPGVAPERYAVVLREAANILESIAAKNLKAVPAPVRFVQRPQGGRSMKTEAQEDVEEQLQIMAKGSQKSPDGVVPNIRVSANTVRVAKDGHKIGAPGWEIFYMEYFLKYTRGEIGPDSFKKLSTPSWAELPPGRYLFQAVHPGTKQKSESKTVTLLDHNPDGFDLFVSSLQ